MNLKDEYNKEFIKELSIKFLKNDSSFDSPSFIKSIINDKWEERELKDRMRFITTKIHAHLNFSYPKQIEILSQIVSDYGGLKGLLFPDFIQVYGIDNLETSLNAIELFTKYSTAEFAIRPFIEKYPDLNADHNSMRCVGYRQIFNSVGCRPKLPWAPALKNFIIDPTPVLPILENLKNGKYLLIALKEENKDYIYQNENDKIAFYNQTRFVENPNHPNG